MAIFAIIPIDPEAVHTEVAGMGPSSVLHSIARLECREADVFKDGAYDFSARLSDRGVWHIFRRESRDGRLEQTTLRVCRTMTRAG